MAESPSENDEEVRLTPTGERIPPQDLIVGELSFGIDINTILEARSKRIEEAKILEEDGAEVILERCRKLYDCCRALEQQGLRDDALYWAVKSNPELLAYSRRYYGFYRGPIWGARQQGVWCAKDPQTEKGY